MAIADNKKNIPFFLVVVFALAFIGYHFLVSPEQSNTVGTTETTIPAPEFSLKDYDGNEVSLESLRGVPLVINSWAAWCPFCVKELPDLVALQEEFQNKIVVIAIDRAESREIAKEFSDARGVTGKIILLLDPADSFYQSIGGFSMPETIFVDREGVVQDHKRGVMELEEMRRRVEKIL